MEVTDISLDLLQAAPWNANIMNAAMRRHLREEDFGFLARAIDEIMTRTPKSVHEGKLVAEAMSILRSNKIDQLVVVDDDQHAIGMIDVQDILDFKV